MALDIVNSRACCWDNSLLKKIVECSELMPIYPKMKCRSQVKLNFFYLPTRPSTRPPTNHFIFSERSLYTCLDFVLLAHLTMLTICYFSYSCQYVHLRIYLFWLHSARYARFSIGQISHAIWHKADMTTPSEHEWIRSLFLVILSSLVRYASPAAPCVHRQNLWAGQYWRER